MPLGMLILVIAFLLELRRKRAAVARRLDRRRASEATPHFEIHVMSCGVSFSSSSTAFWSCCCLCGKWCHSHAVSGWSPCISRTASSGSMRSASSPGEAPTASRSPRFRCSSCGEILLQSGVGPRFYSSVADRDGARLPGLMRPTLRSARCFPRSAVRASDRGAATAHVWAAATGETQLRPPDGGSSLAAGCTL